MQFACRVCRAGSTASLGGNPVDDLWITRDGRRVARAALTVALRARCDRSGHAILLS
jgi:hypothetical protein